MQGKITKRAVDDLAPAGGAETVLWDTEVKGFGVRARAARADTKVKDFGGRARATGGKSYILHYRAGAGRGAALRKLTIGKHGSPWTPETARIEAKRLLAEVAAGRDPATARQQERERMRNAVAAGKTAERIASAEKRRAGSVATGGKGAAAQCVALVSSIYAFAIGRGLCADNPARGVKKAPVRKVERFLSEAEIARLAEALDAEAQQSHNPYPPAAIKLLLLTGCRKGEIANLRWEHVDFERECLRLPDSKTGAKVVYLNVPARALLQELGGAGDRQSMVARSQGGRARRRPAA